MHFVQLVHVDSRLVVFDKPPGLSLATPQREPQAAVERLRAGLAEVDRGRVDGPLWLVHRLDVGTSGLVAVARDESTHRDLIRAFSQRRVEKTYLALVFGHPRPRQGVFDASLGPDREDRRKMRVDPEGRTARTGYRVLGVAPHVALVECRPETGRTHQIRVHLAAAGHPIVGDDFYGGPRHRGVRDRSLRQALDPGHPLLHARRLGLPAPPLPEALEFLATLPAGFARALAAAGLELPD